MIHGWNREGQAAASAARMGLDHASGSDCARWSLNERTSLRWQLCLEGDWRPSQTSPSRSVWA
jgi:hypothetical protein